MRAIEPLSCVPDFLFSFACLAFLSLEGVNRERSDRAVAKMHKDKLLTRTLFTSSSAASSASSSSSAASSSASSASSSSSLDSKTASSAASEKVVDYVVPSDEQISQVLAILNTNTHELQDLGGGGLFLVRSFCLSPFYLSVRV
jgi:hypothetical protein